ncbi:MAG TPA: MMPL family transporter [Spirochaetota bacterium]|nr:MMPL family transporter [Spirochaetota bacterium]HPQ48854.1 MMPL family transporter [Spirochaetota bacterium]
MGFKKYTRNFFPVYLRLIQKHYIVTLIMYIILTLFLGYHASQIEIKTRFIDLLPEKQDSVKDLKKIIDYYGGEGYLIGVVEWSYIYKEPLDLIKNIKSKTEEFKNELKLIIDRDDQKYFAEWLENEGNKKIRDLIIIYEDVKEKIININKNKNDRYFNLFTEELEKNIIKDTKEKWERIEKDSSNLYKADELLYTFEENIRAFDLYKETIIKDKGGSEYLKKFADEISKELEKEKDFIKYVEYKFRTNYIKDHILYFIDIPDLVDIKDRIKKKIDYERRKKILSSSIFVEEPVSLDFSDIQKKYEKTTKVIKITKKTDFFEKANETYEYYINDDGDRLLLLIKPSKESTDVGFAEQLVDKAREIAQKIKKNYPEELFIDYTGRYVKKIEDAKIINRDLKIITPLAFFLIMLSVLIYFKRLRSILVVGIPLASGLVWATGVVKLTIGYFNIVTGFLIGILSGLGVNFAVNLFSRYVEERNRGKDILEALKTTFETTFMSNLTATTTTAAAFLTLTISGFKGFSQFGVTAGLGMLLMLLGILFAFSAIVIISDKINPMKQQKLFKNVDLHKNKRIKGYKIIVGFGLIFTFISFIGIFKVHFNADFYKLAAENTIGKKLEKKAEELIKMSLWPVTIYTKNWETMKELSNYINELKDEYKITTLDKIDSLANYEPENQEEKRKVMLEIKDLLRDSVLNKLKGEEKNKVERLREMVDADFVRLSNVPYEIKRQFEGNVPGYFLFYYPKSNLSMSKISTIKMFVKDLNLIKEKFKDKEIIIASDAIMFDDVLTLINKEAPYIITLVILSLLILLWLDFKSIKEVLTSLFPLTCGILWIFGWAYIFNLEFNYFNVVMFPVIMGIGIDYGVHLLHRYKEEGKHNILFILRTTGIAIAIGGITDIFGFGTLLFAKYKGLATMGQIAIAGITSCLSAGTLFLSSLLELRKDFNKSKTIENNNT